MNEAFLPKKNEVRANFAATFRRSRNVAWRRKNGDSGMKFDLELIEVWKKPWKS